MLQRVTSKKKKERPKGARFQPKKTLKKGKQIDW